MEENGAERLLRSDTLQQTRARTAVTAPQGSARGSRRGHALTGHKKPGPGHPRTTTRLRKGGSIPGKGRTEQGPGGWLALRNDWNAWRVGREKAVSKPEPEPEPGAARPKPPAWPLSACRVIPRHLLMSFCAGH